MESKKTYTFKVRLACEMTNEMKSKIKQSLGVYKVETITDTKRLPIQESPMFPNMGPVEINMFDITVCYPANDDQIRNAIAECGCCAPSAIRVTPADHPIEAIMDGKEVSNPDGDVVLDTPELKAEDSKGLVGEERVENLMKELMNARAYHMPTAAGGKTQAAKTTSDMPQGKLSPVGSKQNKIPSPVK
jgi:hypothetical protein